MVELLVALVVVEVVDVVVYEVLPEVLFSGVSTARLCLVLEFDFSCLPFGFLLAATCSLRERVREERRGGERRERKGEFR